MGVTISHKLRTSKPYVKSMIDHGEIVAQQIKEHQAEKLGIPFEIVRDSDNALFINIGGCETLSFNFKSAKEVIKDGKDGWDYVHAVFGYGKEIDEGYEIDLYPDNEQFYCASCCKTQFAKTLVEHKFVADIIRAVASRCYIAEIHDEGNYYYSGELEDAAEAIEENGKLIDSIGGKLGGLGWEGTEIIKGGSTTIKSRKPRK